MSPLYDAIVKAAAARPNENALVSERAQLTYSQLVTAIDHATARARTFGIGPGNTVIVHPGNPFLLPILSVALVRCGATVAVGITPDDFAENGVPYDVIISNEPAEGSGARHIPATINWVGEGEADGTSARQMEPPGKPPVRAESPKGAPNDFAFIFGSSGTTGRRKLMGFTEARLLARLFSFEGFLGSNRDGHSTTLGLSTFGGFWMLLNPLVGGGTFFVAPPHPSQLFGFLQRWSVPELFCPPATVNALLSQEPRNGQWRPKILRIGGSMSSQTLRRRARALADRVYFVYGSTEVGLVACAYAEEIEHLPLAVGRIIEGVEVGIVDEAGNEVARGEDGIIRVRAPDAIAVRAYLGPQSQSAQWFNGEWFYPGDRGSITADNILNVSGRVNDVINLGGNKVSAESIDDMLSGIPGVIEIAAVGLPGPDGFHDLCVAVVSDKPLESRHFNEVFAAKRLPYRVQRTANVEALPRNEMRKVVRRQVVALFR